MERVSVLVPDRFEIHMRLGDIYKKKKMNQEAHTLYWSALANKSNEAYIHRSVLEIIHKTLSDLKIEKLKKLEGQSSFAQTH
jgi:hypothetical protein